MRLSLRRLAAVRLRHQWPMALAQLLGLAAAIALALTVPLVEAAASEAGLHQVLRGLGSTSYIQLEQFGKADPQSWDSFEDSASARFHSTLGAYAAPGARYAAAGQALPVSVNGVTVLGSGNEPIGDIGYYERLAPHVRVVDGVAPEETSAGTDPYASTMSAEGARQYGYRVGDQMCLVSGVTTTRFRATPSPWCTRLVGTWDPIDTREAYWGGSVPYRTLMLGRTSYFALMQRVSNVVNSRAGQFYGPDLAAINSQNVGDVVNRVNALRGYFGVQREGLFSTGLDPAIKDYLGRVAVAGFTIQLIAAALLVIAAYSVAFLAGHFLDAQAPQLAVLRARGWPPARVLRLILTQYLFLAVLAVPAGVAGALGATFLLARGYLGATAFPVQPADIPGVLPFALATVAGLAVLVVAVAAAAARRDVLAVRRAASRPGTRPWYQWRNLDLGLALLAIPLLVEVRFQGSGDVRAAGANDPTTLVLPALALALLALASLRLMPLAAIVARAAARGVAGNLAAWQISRRPGQHARLAMLLSFTVAVGLFSSVYSATEHRNTLDRADYQSGADVRAVFRGFNQSPPNVDAALARIGRTAATSQAFRGTGSPGRSNLDATILGVDAQSFLDVAWTRGDLAADPIPGLTQRLVSEDPDGLRVAGPVATMQLWVWSRGLDGELLLNLADARGTPCSCSFGSLGFTGERVLVAQVAFPRPPAYPLRLRGLTLQAAPGTRHSGTIAFGGLTAVAPDGTSAEVEPFNQTAGWWHMSQGPLSDTADLEVTAAHPRAGQPSAVLDANLDRGTLVVRPAPSDRPIPALVARTTLDKLGVKLGEAFPMHVDAAVVNVVGVGTVDYFPTLYPGAEDFLVLPRDTLLDRLGHEHYSLAWPNEAWLRLDTAQPNSAVESSLRKSTDLLDIVDRRQVQDEALNDPLRRALQATLLVGFVAALAMALVGFVLHFLVAGRSRLSEYAILQANGLASRTVRRSLLVEQLVLLLFSVVVGAAIALLLSWAILPTLQIGTSISDLVPPTVVTVDPLGATAVLLLIAVVGGAAGVLITRLGGRFNLLDELRGLG